MSLTETSEVFVAVEESALNDLITAVCTTRPHLLHYGSPAFVPANSVSATQMAPIPFPGSPGLQWSVELTIPQLDLFKQDLQLPPELSLGPGQFSLSTVVRLCVDCADRHDGKGDDQDHDHGHDDPKHDDPKHDDPKDDRGRQPWPDDRDDWARPATRSAASSASTRSGTWSAPGSTASRPSASRSTPSRSSTSSRTHSSPCSSACSP